MITLVIITVNKTLVLPEIVPIVLEYSCTGKIKDTMQKRGRPKLYYDFTQTFRKHKIEEQLDIILREGIINFTQHKLALKLRLMFTVNFGLPTVQAYNPSKIPGRSISKYDEDTLYKIRQQYKKIIAFLYKEDKIGAKVLLNIIIHHKMITKDIEQIRNAAESLERAFNNDKSRKQYNTIQNTDNYQIHVH